MYLVLSFVCFLLLFGVLICHFGRPNVYNVRASSFSRVFLLSRFFNKGYESNIYAKRNMYGRGKGVCIKKGGRWSFRFFSENGPILSLKSKI